MSARDDVAEGRAALRAGDVAAARIRFLRATCEAPDDADAWLGLGACRAHERAYDEAVDAFSRAVALAPSAPALLALASALADSGRIDDSIVAARDLVARHPSFAPGWHALGASLGRRERFDEASQAFGEALRVDARYWRAAAALALVELARGRLDDAASAYERWIAIDPASFDAKLGLARARHRQARVLDAVALYRAALAIRDDADARNDLGNAYTDIAEIDAAREQYRAALALRPDYAEVESNLLVNLHYRDDVAPDAMLAAHRDWAARHARVATVTLAPRAVARTRVRVGFASGIFHAGPVGWMLEPVLARLDRDAIAIHCYSNGRYADDVTGRLQSHADAWHDVSQIDDDTLAATIVADDVDILVDLAGHGPGNRLRAIARKPARAIATWLDYFDTTGVDAVDYVLADDVSVPADATQRFTEEVVRFAPSRLCYPPPPEAADVAVAPSCTRGFVTFASFNRLSKLTPVVRDAWARVLRAVPRSRLLLKNAAFADDNVRERFAAHFAALGISRDRVDLRPSSARAAMFAEYADVDIALDPFPYNGGLTTCDALWMGVPVVCVLGDSMISRQGASLLHAAALPQLVSTTVDDYVARAIALAQDADARVALRRTLRPRIAQSPLCDVDAFARRLQSTLVALAARGAR